MGSSRANIVIVHGAWVGGWRWRAVADLLTDRGHRVFTPTLTGLGERAHLSSPSVNVSLHACDIANLVKYERLQNILLVGHSYGGMPMSVAVEMIPVGVIQSIMYMDAFFPEDGQSLNDLVPGPPHLPETAGDYLVPPPRVNLVGFNTHMDPAARAAYEERRVPQSAFCFSEKAVLSGTRELIPKKAYVLATGYKNDTFAPVAEKLRGRPGWRVEEMPYTHDLMHVATEHTASMIESALP